MNQTEKAQHFDALHVAGNPLILYNIWDSGGAKALTEAGAVAIATGSLSVAAAHGFSDGEHIPLEFVLQIVDRIAKTTDLPLTVDFEGGYAVNLDGLMENVLRVISAGAVGINFEDQVIGGDGLHTITDQIRRIRGIRQASAEKEFPLFVNARTDLFLQSEASQHESFLGEALERAAAYAEAGANGFFVPGLTRYDLIGEICQASTLPVNVLMMGDMTSVEDIASVGISRASFGSGPYLNTMAHLADSFLRLQ